ncbi:hypothetical protein [Catellatospora tritici]|uniref:hypothetical protein n=1 Tax=Catellatospora tritici TaxID=2851566 RepID=UPI001C2DB1C4|nr:hypothetical protein [Catellatospora tritici]MBV1851714.1 hypothetical protein [Catellatospora tritici]
MRATRGAAIVLFAAVLLVLSLRVGTAHAAEIPTRPCSDKGVTRTDHALARALNAQLVQGMKGHVSGHQASCARAIVREVQKLGLDRRAAVIAVTTAIVEGNINNFAEAVDYDSLGLYQQRPSAGWGTPNQIMDPAHATDAFLGRMQELYPHGSWHRAPIGAVCQQVQVSAFPDRYGDQAADGQRIVDAIWPAADPA